MNTAKMSALIAIPGYLAALAAAWRCSQILTSRMTENKHRDPRRLPDYAAPAESLTDSEPAMGCLANPPALPCPPP